MCFLTAGVCCYVPLQESDQMFSDKFTSTWKPYLLKQVLQCGKPNTHIPLHLCNPYHFINSWQKSRFTILPHFKHQCHMHLSNHPTAQCFPGKSVEVVSFHPRDVAETCGFSNSYTQLWDAELKTYSIGNLRILKCRYCTIWKIFSLHRPQI